MEQLGFTAINPLVVPNLLDWINDEIVALGEENFFHADYEATLADTYGLDYEDSLVVEGGKVNAQ